MPQITLEYTNNLDPQRPFTPLLDDIHRALNSVAAVNLGNCKSRVRVVNEFHIADGAAEHAFAHIEVRLLEGRSDVVKRELGGKILELVKHWFDVGDRALQVQVTVEITDIRRNEYFKYPAGTFSEIPATEQQQS